MTTTSRAPHPPSLLMMLTGSRSPLRIFAMAAWMLLLAFCAMCTFAAAGVWSGLRGLWAQPPSAAANRAANVGKVQRPRSRPIR